jgi:hypothetical protein
VVGAELVVGYVFAWLARKGWRAARRTDAQVDQAIDTTVDRLGGKLHELVLSLVLTELSASAMASRCP